MQILKFSTLCLGASGTKDYVDSRDVYTKELIGKINILFGV